MYSLTFETDCSFPISILFKKLSVCADTRKFKVQSNYIKRIAAPISHGNNALDWCPQCIETFDDLIDVVLNIILEFGVLDTCGHLCDLVAQKTGSGLLGFICDIGCDFLGLEEFIKLVQKADLDPIYYCEKINLSNFESTGFLIEAKKSGSYSERLTIDTTADPTTSKKFVFC
jgi:hypothetical protein